MNESTFQEKLRKAVIKYKQDHTIRETANFFEIATVTVSRWNAQYKNEGSLLPRKRSEDTYFSVVDEKGKQFLISEIEKKNDATLEELRQKYLEKFDELIGVSTIHGHLKTANISLKKKAFTTPSKMKTAFNKSGKTS
jgi:transposase